MSETTRTETKTKLDTRWIPLIVAVLTFSGLTATDFILNGEEAVWNFQWWDGDLGLSEAAIPAAPIAGLATYFLMKWTNTYGRTQTNITHTTRMKPDTTTTKKDVWIPG